MGSPSAKNPFYKCKILRKMRNKSQTTGSTKSGGHCKATLIDRYMATRNRSYKDYRYKAWYEKVLKQNKLGG